LIEAYKVSWLTHYLKELVESDLKLSDLWVEGEVSNLTRSAAGHTYFTLKDEEAQMRCVMFRRAAGGTPIESGDQVLAHGNVSFYEIRGDLQIIVDFVQPAGVGAFQAEFERLREKLESEGLFDPARKRPLPAFPRRIGVVTSPTGAVFHDIRNVIGRRWPLAEVVLAPTAVQGVDAPGGICRAIERLNEEEDLDVIIVGRGGGSLEELAAFNEESVARAIYGSGTPVVSGVGHETDFTIADYVADARAPTPSAAAEMVVPDGAEILHRVGGMAGFLQATINEVLVARRVNLERAAHRLRLAVPEPAREAERVASMLRHAQSAIRWHLDQRTGGLGAFAAQLRSLNPTRTLARGYAVVQVRDSKAAVTSVRQVKGRDRLDIHVKDGRFPAEVSRQYGF
jgi:exodeoxyribonuclease VII large subunit